MNLFSVADLEFRLRKVIKTKSLTLSIKLQVKTVL